MKHLGFIIGLVFLQMTFSHSYNCDRTPQKAEDPKDNIDKYVLEISGNPETYSPETTYTIALKSSPSNPITNHFTEFMIVVEPENPSKIPENVGTGDLTPVDPTVSKFTPRCPNAVIQKNNLAKSHVEILWKAPPATTEGNNCISIKAMVFESSDSWFIDTGGLVKTLCQEEENEDVQPPFSEECCACHEAKYEIAFQGMWTRNTHPKDYPSNMWTTKLGDVIGASHKFGKAFWNYSEVASDGLKLLAEEGDTSLLENELKEMVKTDDIRTIIKARELPYPNITGTSYTVFRVDKDNHLISLVSKITPSPDWIVGVANLELCLQNCSWVQSRNLNLYPWDVGTDDGTTYQSPDSPSASRQIVRQIIASDENYPFYRDDGEPIKPIAKLHITRQKLYDKVCEEEDDKCKLSEWSDWTKCDCDTDKYKTRTKQFENPENEEYCSQNGKHPLEETIECTPEECELARKCAQATWSDWGPCSVTCGTGTHKRNGTLPEEDENKETTNEESEEIPCVEEEPCYMPLCDDEETTLTSESLVSDAPVDCKVSKWSEWSSCDAREPCTGGNQFRERRILVHPQNGGKPCPKRLKKVKYCEAPCAGNVDSKETLPSWGPARRGRRVDCVMGPWSVWSPCSSNCGDSAVQQRTRAILVYPSRDGKKCEPRLEVRKCSLPYACRSREYLQLSKH
ncbi:spondin-1 [Tribolium castaneum]|uniref:Spondin-1 n=1 Tax=Tribolium castaneum TaxID=7070 RepID=D2A0T9_TRICA|nr:PREDICTED: spondin-1 [Tribolium castaneum]EFA01634.1 Spondin-1-like Protein [Tribolium castaneum]|eukprot:XP_008192553.1 PREDICTED: spondin-1 [Tribolium castaneum]